MQAGSPIAGFSEGIIYMISSESLNAGNSFQDFN